MIKPLYLLVALSYCLGLMHYLMMLYQRWMWDSLVCLSEISHWKYYSCK